MYGAIVPIGTKHESILGVFPELPVGLCVRATLVASVGVMLDAKIDSVFYMHGSIPEPQSALFGSTQVAGRAKYMRLNMYPKRLLRLKEVAVSISVRSRRPRILLESRSRNQTTIGKVDGEPPLGTA